VRRTARAVWGLAALAVVIVVVLVIAGAFRAHGESAFNRWGVWAAVAAVPLAGLPVVLALWDKITGSTDKPELDRQHGAGLNCGERTAPVTLRNSENNCWHLEVRNARSFLASTRHVRGPCKSPYKSR
jgi:hypothetical protein